MFDTQNSLKQNVLHENLSVLSDYTFGSNSLIVSRWVSVSWEIIIIDRRSGMCDISFPRTQRETLFLWHLFSFFCFTIRDFLFSHCINLIGLGAILHVDEIVSVSILWVEMSIYIFFFGWFLGRDLSVVLERRFSFVRCREFSCKLALGNCWFLLSLKILSDFIYITFKDCFNGWKNWKISFSFFLPFFMNLIFKFLMSIKKLQPTRRKIKMNL